MRTSSGLVLFASVLWLAGCASSFRPSPADTAPGAAVPVQAERIPTIKQLKGTSWVLVELDGQSITPPPAGWSPQSLDFGPEGLRITGNAGVNRFGARYSQTESGLVFGPLALTRRLGPAELMETEQRYTHVLSRVVEWRQDGARLVLITPGSRGAAVFERLKPSR